MMGMARHKTTTRTQGIIAYVRVSTDEQASSGLGLAAQEAAITAEATRRGLPIIAWLRDEGVSAKTTNRPALLEALAMLGRGEGSVLMVAKLDRLTRSVHDATGLLMTAEREGWGIVALDAPVDTTTPQGLAMSQILAVFAELERRLISERTKAALAAKRAQGAKLGRPRSLPTDVVERIRARKADGASWSAIARELNADGIPTAQGGAKWYPGTVRYVALEVA